MCHEPRALHQNIPLTWAQLILQEWRDPKVRFWFFLPIRQFQVSALLLRKSWFIQRPQVFDKPSLASADRMALDHVAVSPPCHGHLEDAQVHINLPFDKWQE
jgi:hypothetical protein